MEKFEIDPKSLENSQVIDDIQEYKDADPYLVDLLDQIEELKKENEEHRKVVKELKEYLSQYTLPYWFI